MKGLKEIECIECGNSFFVEDLKIDNMMPANYCPFCGIPYDFIIDE